MLSSESEKLQETTLDLLRSQDRERELLNENTAILAGISAMAGASNKTKIFNSLLEVLQKFIGFNNAIVLSRDDENTEPEVLVSTQPELELSQWKVGQIFTRCINGECVSLYSPKDVEEFQSISPKALELCQSVLVTGVKVSSGDAIILLINSNKSQFTPKCRRVLTRFRPLLERAIIDIDYRERLQSLVTAKTQQLTHSQQRFRDFAKTVGDWFWEIDTDYNFTYISAPSFSHHIKKQDNFLDFFSEYHSFQNELKTKLAEKNEFEDLEWQSEGDTDKQWFSFSGTPYFDRFGKFLGYRGTAKNISARKKRLFDLQQAQKQAESANKAKSQFIAMMSHEIRTPLNAVLGLMETLSLSGLNEEQQLWLNQMDQSAKLLLTIINDILDLSRIESRSFRLFNSNINIVDSIVLVTDQLRNEATKKGVILECDIDKAIPEKIVADKNRITQIMFNLIGNAVKFTDEGLVRVVASKVDNNIEIAVIDTGIGIAEEAQGKIFNLFHQADGSITRRYGGTGLGLAISLHLIEKMNGTIKLESSLGKGSCFTVALPITLPSKQDIKIEPDRIQKSSCSLNILLAEDSKTNQLVARLMLERRGHKVFITNNGQEAIDVLLKDHQQFDLVLMDISMPVLDGLEATKHLQQNNINLPIVALTANAMESDQQIYHDAGMDGYISKPICAIELDALLDKYQRQKDNKSSLSH